MDLISTLRYAAQAAKAATTPSEEEPAPLLHADLIKAYSLAGRTAVVTGAGRGIGRQTAITFAQAGASVVLADVDPGAAELTAKSIAEIDGRSEVVATDVSRKADMEALAQRALTTTGRLDVWANIAGIITDGPLVDATEDEVQRVVAVNQLGVLWGCAAAAGAMIPSKRGSIINVASAGGELPSPGVGVYGMTKAAVISMTRTLAAELGPHGIRANTVSPGFVETPMTSRNFTDSEGNVDETKRSEHLALRARVPLGRVGTPQDIANAMLFLATDASSFVTGQVIRPNGGVIMG